uniref:C2H2-type domain-containing protein n=1 Tax=Sander lucioperca TaxID=283035 RepID=A0A8D0AFX5_SANLU
MNLNSWSLCCLSASIVTSLSVHFLFPADVEQLVKMMKRKLSPHSFITDKLNTWKQKLMERTVEDQNQPGTHIHFYKPETEDKASDCSEPETDVSDEDCKLSREPQPALSSLNNDEVPVSDFASKSGKKSFVCGECGRRFGRKDSLRRHMRFHTGEKPYSCSVCSKRFSQRPNLIRHMRCHSGEKPFGCSFCDASFAVRSALVNHMRIHTGEKPFGCIEPQSTLKCNRVPVSGKKTGNRRQFSCSECGKRFSKKTNLKVHMVVHSAVKPFSCTVCGKRFSQKGNLVRHILHTGEKPFSCSVCSKRFVQRYHYLEHTRLHTGEDTFDSLAFGSL